jgi:hypothetical protein
VLCCRDYNLVPIAIEDYTGDDSGVHYAVAVARRANVYLTLFNMKRMLHFCLASLELQSSIMV